MFGKDDGGSAVVQSQLNTILGKGARFKGTFEGQGTVRVESELVGNVEGADMVVVGKTGVVRGEIHAKQVVVTGQVQGKIVATEKAELQGGSRVQADILSPRLVIEEGVFFEGSCKMETEAPLQGTGTQREAPARLRATVAGSGD